ncbi:MAG: NfeD family protein [Desulfobulbaceae bacterium]|nr:NfeD family protein [Desulfobulbaceae bacterium]
MQYHMEYWQWLAFGMLLIIAELFIPSFTIFWFGLGAIIVAALLWLAPGLDFAWQLFIWALASAIFTFLWFRYFKRLMPDRTKAGVAKEAIVGESGRVIQAPEEHRHGRVRFATPLLGSDEWSFTCAESVVVGDRVHVQDISGNTLIVEKRPKAGG